MKENKNNLIIIAIIYLLMNNIVFSSDVIWFCGWMVDNPYGWIKGSYREADKYTYMDIDGTTKSAIGYNVLLKNSNGVNDITDPILEHGIKINNILDITSDATNDNLIEQARDINSQIEKKNIKNNPKILVGHSQGGLKAFAYMSEHDKENVKGIISVGTPWKGAHIIKNKNAIIEYRDEVIERYDELEKYYDRIKNRSFVKAFNKSDPFENINIKNEFTGGIWSMLLPSENSKIKAPIDLESAQSMNPEGDYIIQNVQNIVEKKYSKLDYNAMKRFTTTYFMAKYGYTPKFFNNQSFISTCTNEELLDYFKKHGLNPIYISEIGEEWNGKKSIPSHVKIGSIIGIHSDIWSGVAQSQKAGIFEREYKGMKTEYNQYGPYEVPHYVNVGYVAKLNKASRDLSMLKTLSRVNVFDMKLTRNISKVRSRVRRLRSHIRLENIQKRYDGWVESDEHDGLIATFSQEMTPNLGGDWIGKTQEKSNIRMDVYHMSMDKDDDRTKEEMQNDRVREQIRDWIKIIEEGDE